MEFNATTLDSLNQGNPEPLVTFYKKIANKVFFEAKLMPVIADARVIEAHGAWQHDLNRVERHEPQLSDGLDHFKCSGHLSFWLRKMLPIVEAHSIEKMFTDPQDQIVTTDEQAFRDLLLGYSNEYVAFEIGFQICKFFESDAGSERARTLIPSTDYYQIMCHFLKYKTVSPHALMLTFKSLFAK